MTMPADADAYVPPKPGFIKPGCPTMQLGGLTWPMPSLASRQLRVVVPRILKLIKHMIPVMSAMKTAQSEGVKINDALQQLELLDITEETMDDLNTVLWCAMTRGSPKLTKDEFLDLPFDLMGLVSAFPVVLAASGLFDAATGLPKVPAGVPNMGEASKASIGTG